MLFVILKGWFRIWQQNFDDLLILLDYQKVIPCLENGMSLLCE